MGYAVVKAGAFAENAASIRGMEKCGMKKIPYEEEVSYQDTAHHRIYYEIQL